MTVLVAMPGVEVVTGPGGMEARLTTAFPLLVVTLATGEGVVSPPCDRKVTAY